MNQIPNITKSYNWFDQKYAAVLNERIGQIRRERLLELNNSNVSNYLQAVTSLANRIEKKFALVEGRVLLGSSEPLENAEQEVLLNSLRTFAPWKKGPFSICGTEIDAEWRSDLKWNRVKPFLNNLKGKRVCDVGCHNGFFMFHLQGMAPEVVVGLEPVLKHLLCFELLQDLAGQQNLIFEPLGVEHINHYPQFFDCVLMMGILYHHTDPVGLLRKAREAMRPGAQLIIDCQGIPGDDSQALVPAGRYAGASGIWFLPTKKCLENWLLRSGFREINVFFAEPLSTDEQRPTPWAEIKSLGDFLSADRSKTIEGYPAPWRFYASCIK